MTKKELLEAIKDMPEDTPIKAVIRLKAFHYVEFPNLEVDIDGGMIKIKNVC